MSLFSNIKYLLNKDKDINHIGPDRQEAFQTLPKAVLSPGKEDKEKVSGGTVVRQEKALQHQNTVVRQKDPQLTSLEMPEEGGWACKAATVYHTGDLIANRYKVENVLSGAMGYVYICKDTSQRIMFAIKQPKTEMLADRELFSRVLLEADAWTKLGMHPNIAYCYFVRVIEEVPYIFIEYVDGGSLEDWISDRRCADYKTGIDMAIQFCHGLERAHDRGMIHRDIKPKNILVTKDGQVKVTDFGLVGGGRAGGKVSTMPGDQHGTRMGDIMGTPAYMPPEQWNDPRQKSAEAPEGVWYESDVYSFGICMWEMFCGRKPYEVSIGVKGGPPDPRELKRDIPDGLRELLLDSVALERGKRQADFRDLKEELNRVYRELYGGDAPHYKLELHDTTADELNNQGYSFLELGRKEEARKCYEEAVKASKIHPEVVFNLALLQWRDNKIDDLEVIRRIRNCLSNPVVSKEKIAELLAYIHAERFDLSSAKEELSEYSGKFDKLYQGRIISTIGCRSFTGHSDSVTSVSLSYDGRYALSGSRDNTLKLWEVETGKCLHTFEGHIDSVESVSLMADGKYALSGSKDKTLKSWEVETGKCLHTFEGHSNWVTSVCLSTDGRYAVSGSMDKTLKLWEIETGKCLRTFEGHSHWVSSVCLSSDGRYALSGSYNTLKLWKIETGECLRTFEGHGYGVNSVCLSSDSKYALSGSSDNTLKLWEVETGKCLRTFEGRNERFESVSLSADGRYALSGGDTLKLWEIETGKLLRTVEGHGSHVQSVILSADGRYVLSGNLDKTLRLWDVNLNNDAYICDFQVTAFKGFEEIKGAQDELSLAITQAERLTNEGKHTKAFAMLYSAWERDNFKYNKRLMEVYLMLYARASTRTFSFGYLENTFEGHSDFILSVSFSADSRFALSGSFDKKLKLWEVDTGKCLRTFGGQSNWVKSVRLSANASYALSGSEDKTLRLWEVETGKCLRTFEGHSSDVNSVSLSADDIYALSGSRDKTLKLWEVETGKCLRTFEGHSDIVYSLSLSIDSRYVLSGSYDKTLKLWDVETGKCLRTFEGHSKSVNSVSLSSDSRYAFSGSSDNTLKLWEIETGKCLHTFEGHSGIVDSVSLSVDGRYALSGSWDKTLKLWRLIWKLEFDENK
ncbi:MAG: protein kinase [Desulfobacterium sp.]|nr:protein kinase [Desulfobacterium sp.]